MQSATSGEYSARAEDSVIRERVTNRNRKKQQIPEYLPDEILAMEPQLELPADSSALNENVHQRDRRARNIHFRDEKAPKDLKYGSTKVRVLSENNKLLPPKANAQSRRIRESWLEGRPGKRGQAMFERQTISKPFLVK